MLVIWLSLLSILLCLWGQAWTHYIPKIRNKSAKDYIPDYRHTCIIVCRQTNLMASVWFDRWRIGEVFFVINFLSFYSRSSIFCISLNRLRLELHIYLCIKLGYCRNVLWFTSCYFNKKGIKSVKEEKILLL